MKLLPLPSVHSPPFLKVAHHTLLFSPCLCYLSIQINFKCLIRKGVKETETTGWGRKPYPVIGKQLAPCSPVCRAGEVERSEMVPVTWRLDSVRHTWHRSPGSPRGMTPQRTEPSRRKGATIVKACPLHGNTPAPPPTPYSFCPHSCISQLQARLAALFCCFGPSFPFSISLLPQVCKKEGLRSWQLTRSLFLLSLVHSYDVIQALWLSHHSQIPHSSCDIFLM